MKNTSDQSYKEKEMGFPHDTMKLQAYIAYHRTYFLSKRNKSLQYNGSTNFRLLLLNAVKPHSNLYIICP